MRGRNTFDPLRVVIKPDWEPRPEMQESLELLPRTTLAEALQMADVLAKYKRRHPA